MIKIDLETLTWLADAVPGGYAEKLLGVVLRSAAADDDADDNADNIEPAVRVPRERRDSALDLI